MIESQTANLTAFLKFGFRDHMTQLRKEGLLFCNPLAYFRSQEAASVRRDLQDGISFSHLARDVTAVVISNMEREIRLTPENGLAGRVNIHLGGQEPNVYCMYALRSEDLPWRPPSTMHEFGDSGVLIKDMKQFWERLIQVVSESGMALQRGLVEYVNEESYSGELGVFRKLSDFAFQSELRFAIEPGSPDPIEIRLGSIEDISVQFDLDENTDLEVCGC